MKTKFRTFIGIVALGLFGLININATANNKSEEDAKVVSEKTEGVTNESGMIEDIYWTILAQNETWESENPKEVENELNLENEFIKAAESFTAKGVDNEIKKYADKQVSLENAKKGK